MSSACVLIFNTHSFRFLHYFESHCRYFESTLRYDSIDFVTFLGAVDQYNCIYVTPQTGQTVYKFDIMYDQCGSKPDLNGRFYENNIVVQVRISKNLSDKCM